MNNNKYWHGFSENETFVHCWQKYKLVQSILKNNTEVPQKCKRELPRDPAIPLWGIYPKKLKFICQRDICAFMFNSANN